MTTAHSESPPRVPADLPTLDRLTGGVFTAPTSSERAARVRAWLASEPAVELMQAVFKELSGRDKGAARPLKEKLDEVKRARLQEGLLAEWAEKARQLLAQPRLHVADAMAWQRDAAKAGAPLSREPLAALRQQLADRIKAVDDLQNRIQVAREAAVLLAQRIEVLSTKPLADAQQAQPTLAQDVAQWQQQAQALQADAQWESMEPRFATMLQTARTQLGLVWEAFEAALHQAAAAVADAAAPLPAVPVWAEEIRAARGEPVAAAAGPSREEVAAARAQAAAALQPLTQRLAQELEQGHSKAVTQLAQELRRLLKEHHRWLTPEVEGPAQALLAQAGDLEGWQRWRADQLRQELVAKAEALTAGPEGERPTGRKLQEALRSLREAWKQSDQGGVPNHALWKRFDAACTRAHEEVEAWLAKVRAQAEQHKAQRLALIEELRAWTAAHQADTDWRARQRELHRFAEAWRHAGHLSEKLFAELQPQWKAAMEEARAPLEAAQAANVAQRQALIARAAELAQSVPLRVEEVKALQQQWQALAHAVPLDRRQEQQLWEAFRQPIDQAFQRKDQARAQAVQAMSQADRRVLEAVAALQQAIESEDAQRIQAAMRALQQAEEGAAAVSAPSAEEAGGAPAAGQSAQAEAAQGESTSPAAGQEEAVAAPAVRKVVAVRGDDRPGARRPEGAAAGVGRAAGRVGDRPAGARREAQAGEASRGGRRGAAEGGSALGVARGPRLGEAAFRARREALEQATQVLRKLAAQAHGQSLMKLMEAWQARDAQQVPSAQELGGRVNAAVRQSWLQALEGAPQDRGADAALLRLEMAAELPTPAAHLQARRALQLQLLTRRHDPAPAQTWAQDVATVLASAWQAEVAERLLATLKVLVKPRAA